MSRTTPIRRLQNAIVAVAIMGVAVSVRAQAPLAVDDDYGVPLADPLAVEFPGVLSNDTAGAGATVELLRGVDHGVLDCDSDPTAYDLCPDGSFTYTPDGSFTGFDSFTYQVVDGGGSSQATVTLSACTGGPTRFVCWQESAYLAKLGELGYGTISEGFEDDTAWGTARWSMTEPSVLSQGVIWTTNHPATNPITTGTGPALTGTWGVYDPDHGYATGTLGECTDVVPLPPECLFKDGVTGTRQAGESTLYGAGGHFKGTTGALNLVAILDGGAPVGLGKVPSGGHRFRGVIDTGGFSSFRFEEIDGKVGQERFAFADDFTLGTTPADTTPPQVLNVGSLEDTGDGTLAEGEVTSAAITQLTVDFSEPIQSAGGYAAGDVTNLANYLLVSDGGDGFETASCAGGVAGNDVQMAVDGVTWDALGILRATVSVNGGVALDSGSYLLLVCGSTSILDWSGNALDGDANGVGGDDFARSFTVTQPLPSISIADLSLAEGDSGTTEATFTVTLSAQSAEQVTVAFSTADGSARAGSDYQSVSGSLVFPPNSLSQPLAVTILGDLDAEADEDFVVDLTGPSGATLADSQAVGTILNDDPWTWYVSAAGSDSDDCVTPTTPCLTVTEAHARAFAGDTILVAPGTYPEHVVLTKNLTVMGAGSGTVLDGFGSGVVLTIEPAVAAAVSGFEIRNGGVGGIEVLGTLTLGESWIHGNGNGTAGTFGALSNTGSATIERCTLSENLGDFAAAASNSGQLTIVNSSLHANRASSGTAIDNQAGGTLALSWVTVADNGAVGIGGGGTTQAEATIVSGHTTANCDAVLVSLGHNLEDADSCGLVPGSADLINSDPILGVLAADGWWVPTMRPGPTSPVLDGADSPSCPSIDQRGVARPIDGDEDGIPLCDIGSVEAAPATDQIFADGFEGGTTAGWSAVGGGV